MACIVPRATYFDKLLEIQVKWAKVYGSGGIFAAQRNVFDRNNE
jgi:hypothetical protein